MSVNYVHLPHSPQESVTSDPFDLACAQAARRGKARQKLIQWDGIHGENLPCRARSALLVLFYYCMRPSAGECVQAFTLPRRTR